MTISHFQKDLSLKRDLGEIIYLIIQYLSCVLESICIKFRRGKTNMNKKKQTKIQEILTSELTNWIIISCSSAFVEYFYVETNY